MMEQARTRPHILMRRWRLLAGGLAGAIGVLGAHDAGLPPGLSSLIGWNAASVAFLIPTLWMLWHDDEAKVRRRACYEDESRWVTLVIIMSAVVASLGATVVAMHESKAASDHAPIAPSWSWIFSITTLVLGWIVVQAVFTLHYAHRYFGDGDDDGEIDRGVTFPGKEPSTYHDFIYMAVCIGTSAQVSDFNITNTSFRRLVTLHALLAFLFNTMVLALGINILATIIGQ
ncbi:MAG: DUF1345 domain-containing protein [Caulobacteraceae bacterium]|nr:DUF1345 domain-containing protein [Caulobacteraceae bacterium]